MKYKLKNSVFLVCIAIILVVIMVSCHPSYEKSIHGDIIFTYEKENNVYDLVGYSVSDQRVDQLETNDLIVRAKYFRSENVLIGIRPVHGILVGYPVLFDLKTNKTKTCKGLFYDNIFDDPRSADPYDVITTSAMSVHSFNVKSCTVTNKLVDFESNNSNGNRIFGSSLSNDGKLLYYGILNYKSDTRNIIRLDLKTKKETIIADGFAPALSSDGNRLVYINNENELVLLDVIRNEKIIIMTNINNETSIVPVLEWSSDDRLLLVQTYNSDDLNLFNSTMLVVDIVNQSYDTIENKGLFPSWIK